MPAEVPPGDAKLVDEFAAQLDPPLLGFSISDVGERTRTWF